LGRKVIWAARRLADRKKFQEYVPRLRIYPHALREANAYYSPQKKALLFGYFAATPANPAQQMPGSLVFTCLSHDIIAHETTHAILDGMHRFYNEPSNPDVLAFHEAFADIVALFQHFTFPEVLQRQIAETKGDLAAQNLLGKLAQEFGTAIGNYGSLRDAIGTDESGKWEPKKPNVDDYLNTSEPHERGSILVAAVFEAFINIYKNRAADLLRIASNGSGVLSRGELHPDLVNRLAGEASKAAGHVLSMCVRALDYCPPVDLTFGEYLRAIITADADLVADDRHKYRLIFIEAFRRRGIFPQGIKTLGVDSLRYPLEPAAGHKPTQLFKTLTKFLRAYRNKIMYETDRKKIYQSSREFMGRTAGSHVLSLHQRVFLNFEESPEFERLTGLVFGPDWKDLGIRTSRAYGRGEEGPSFSVENLRLVSRVGPDGNQINQIVFSLAQRAGVLLKDGKAVGHYTPRENDEPQDDGMQVRGGCTLIFDLDTLKLKYAISKPLLDLTPGRPRQLDLTRIEQQAAYQNDGDLMAASEYNKFFEQSLNSLTSEPFALLHRH
jgi:quinol monooxygenase YgiN